jgi:hypothetical protein
MPSIGGNNHGTHGWRIKTWRQIKISFRLGHSIQGKNRPWKKRYAKPFSPKDKDEASRIVREIFISSGLPPVEYIFVLAPV